MHVLEKIPLAIATTQEMMLTLGYKKFQPYYISERVVNDIILFQFSGKSIRDVSVYAFWAIIIWVII